MILTKKYGLTTHYLSSISTIVSANKYSIYRILYERGEIWEWYSVYTPIQVAIRVLGSKIY